MYNWSIDTTCLKKNKADYTIWKLEQLINFGLNNERIKKKEIVEHWDHLEIDPARKKFLRLLLWPSKQS